MFLSRACNNAKLVHRSAAVSQNVPSIIICPSLQYVPVWKRLLAAPFCTRPPPPRYHNDSLGIIIAFIVVQWVFLLGQACQATRDEKDLPIEVALIYHPMYECSNGPWSVPHRVSSEQHWLTRPRRDLEKIREWIQAGRDHEDRNQGLLVWIGLERGPHDLRLGEFDIY